MNIVDELLKLFINIPKKDIEYAVNNNVDLLPILQNNIYKISMSIIRFFGRMYWNDIESYLTNTDKMLELLIRIRPELKDVLDTPKGKLWLYENLKRIYPYIYKLIWG